MSSVLERGLFIGLNDGYPTDQTVSVVTGSLSAMILHADFSSRRPVGHWELAVPNDRSLLTRSHILQLLKSFVADSSDEAAMIYFAGHGCAFEGKYIFCPQDFQLEIPDASGIPLELLASTIQRGSRHPKPPLVLIFDTCRTLIDQAPETGDQLPSNCSIIYTCAHGNEVVEVDGYSDFVRAILFHLKSAARSKGDGTTHLRMADLIRDLQGWRPPAGSGRALQIETRGQWLEDIYFRIETEPSEERLTAIPCKLLSRPRPAGICGRYRGEMLNKIAHSLGIAVDPQTVEIHPSEEAGAEVIHISIQLTQPTRNARILDWIVREWNYFFTDLVLRLPSGNNSERLSRILRHHGFDIFRSSIQEMMAIKKLRSVAAKVELLQVAAGQLELRLSCLGEEEKRGLERLDDTFFLLVRDLIQVGLSA